MSIAVIINPRSANGRTAALWARVRGCLSQPVEVFETSAPGHAIELTAAALRNGARTVVAVGGDGTINEVVNGFFDGTKPIAPNAALAIIPHGTGSDFRRSLKLPSDEKKATDVIERGSWCNVDVARVIYTSMDGASAVRYSINLTSFGMGGAVAARANRSSKLLGGRISFLIATLRTALEYSARNVTVVLDDTTTVRQRITNVAIGNGQYHGGGMWVCPRASLEDGRLDVTFIRQLSLFSLVRSLPYLYNGKIQEHPAVELHTARRVEARSDEITLIEIDGEPLGKLPILIEVVPHAIRVLTP
jgi:YegS/Rv2252/BmrU family lipid kinase